jgi:N utilization substance protein B
MGRKEARETAFKLVYERCITNEDNEFSFNILTEGFSENDKAFVSKLLCGTKEKNDYINHIISVYSKDFLLERVFKVDLAALIIAIYEILFCQDIPYQIAANEAIELSKKYSTDLSYKFINGVLSSVIRSIDELSSDESFKNQNTNSTENNGGNYDEGINN